MASEEVSLAASEDVALLQRSVQIVLLPIDPD